MSQSFTTANMLRTVFLFRGVRCLHTALTTYTKPSFIALPYLSHRPCHLDLPHHLKDPFSPKKALKTQSDTVYLRTI